MQRSLVGSEMCIRDRTNTLILLNDQFSNDEKKKYTAPIKTFAPESDKILSSVGQREPVSYTHLTLPTN
ncbi:hypothetical protein JMUB7518_28000 [Staphylococcus aureus]